jgi:hypothetical protein
MSGSTTMIADHVGFAHDDTNVMLLVSNPGFTPQTVACRLLIGPERPDSGERPFRAHRSGTASIPEMGN